MLGAGALFGISGVIAKWLSSSLSAFQVVFWRFAIAFLALLIIATVTRTRLSVTTLPRAPTVAFALSFPAAIVLFTLSVFHGSVASAVFSFYVALLVSSAGLGRLFFGERLTLFKSLALFAGLAAAVVLTRPWGHFHFSLALLYGLASGLVQAIASIFQKQLAPNTSRLTLLALQTLAGTVIAGLLLAFAHRSPLASLGQLSPGRFFVLAIYGLILLAITQLFLIGFTRVALNVSGVLLSSEIFFGPLFATLLLGEPFTSTLILAGSLALVAAVLAHLPSPGQRTSALRHL
jgi:drug/metabolite transporter (DMT)-like permease